MTLLKLRNDIARHQAIYYNGGGSPVSDSTYDGWVKELKKLSPDDPLLTAVGSPVPADSALQKVEHKHHMGSLNNAMNEEEFLAWHQKMVAAAVDAHMKGAVSADPMTYSVSFKMDGASAELVYENGELVQGSTRGDGAVGEDITANVLKMQGVPRFVTEPPILGGPVKKHLLPFTDKEIARMDRTGVSLIPDGPYIPLGKPFTGFVRGEIMLFKEEFKKLDDPEDPSNPRNLGNGMARRKDGEGCEHLRFVAFRGFGADGKPLGSTESENLKILADLGFSPVTHWVNQTQGDVFTIHRYMQGLPLVKADIMPAGGLALADPDGTIWLTREELPFEIDGLVVKVEDLALQERLGEATNRPKGQIAFKFTAMSAVTTLESVEWTVGHTGAIIPTAILTPVRIGGVTVSRALLCNTEEIERLGVGIGDSVEVYRAGDVIPKIAGVDKSASAKLTIFAPTTCPECCGKAGKRKGVKGDESVHLFCLNPQCSAQALGKIKTWVKKIDIQGLGDVFLEQLFQDKIVESIADLYRLWTPKKRPGLLAVLGDKRASKVIDEIDGKRILDLSDFIGSLGIDGLGRRRVTLVRQAQPGEFDTLQDWTSGKLVEQAHAVGLPNVAAPIQEQINRAMPLIRELLEAGVAVHVTTTKKPMAKKSDKPRYCFVLTGKFPEHPKAWYHDKIVAAGHDFEESYKKGIVTHLVASDPGSGSSKMKKAEKDGVPVITEVKLFDMLSR